MPEPVNISPKLNVIVVGAGVAGLSLGAALRGICNVTILENHPSLREYGAAFGIAPQAHKIINSWGAELASRYGAAIDALGAQGYNPQGKLLYKTDFPPASVMGASYSLCHRIDAQQELYRLSTREDGPGNPCKVVYDAKVVDVDVDAGIVTTASGETFKGDAIYGADGIRSKVRKFIISREVPLIPSGLTSYRTTIFAKKLEQDPEIKATGYISPRITVITSQDKMVITYPCRHMDEYNLLCILPDAHVNEQVGTSWDAVTDDQTIINAFDDFSPMWKRLFALGTKPGVWQLCDIEPLETWVKGRCMIVGDAAHGMLPFMAQGASSAIEDAEAIAFCLGSITDPAQVPAALHRAWRIRYQRVSTIQRYGRQPGIGPDITHHGEKKLNPMELAACREFGYKYNGAEAWEKEHPEML